ncbi:MAG: ATP-binding protein, partial [Candidatus Thorarchaeota archaeon]
EKWYETVKDPTIADAILDRIVHNAYKIELSGGSMRKSMREVYSKIEESDNKNTNEKERD